MIPYFDTPEKIAQLRVAAESWKGTKFMPNASVKGVGVSCQTLAGGIYNDAGFMPDDFMPPDGKMDWGQSHSNSRFVSFMSTLKQFELMPEGTKYQAGDMVGFKLGGCIQHCGVVLDNMGDFVHCLRPQGVTFWTLKDATYMSRIEKIWRPIKT